MLPDSKNPNWCTDAPLSYQIFTWKPAGETNLVSTIASTSTDSFKNEEFAGYLHNLKTEFLKRTLLAYLDYNAQNPGTASIRKEQIAKQFQRASLN